MWPALFLTSNHSHIRQLQFATQAFSQKVLQQAVQINICQWSDNRCRMFYDKGYIRLSYVFYGLALHINKKITD